MILLELVSYCFLTPTQQFFSYIMANNKLHFVIFNEIMMRSALYMLSWIAIVLAH
jgi:hypothetical protein